MEQTLYFTEQDFAFPKKPLPLSSDEKQAYKDRIIAFGDVSQAGLRKKMAFVIEEMADRLRNFDLKWSDVTKVQAYSVHDIALLVDELLAKPGLIQHGLTWHFARPPVAGLDYEMDLRGSVNELFSDD